MPSKSVLPRGFKALAERLSEEYREKLGVSKFAPLNAFKLAEYLGIRIYSVDEIFEGTNFPLDHDISNDPAKFSAVWLPNSDGDKIIIHNTNHSEYRQQSNLMHELSHIIRNHVVPDDVARLCAQLNLPYINPLHEEEAKYLGGCLQITKPGLLWSLKQGFSIEKISQYYHASLDMVKYRMSITGVAHIKYRQQTSA